MGPTQVPDRDSGAPFYKYQSSAELSSYLPFLVTLHFEDSLL
jgi:hypothetical protein